jgi:ribosomal protein L7/L12
MPAAFDADQLIRRFDLINERFRRIEAQLEILSQKAGVPFDLPADEVPPEVVQLAQQGKQLEAIKKYRELTGADFDTARNAVLVL